MRILFLFIMLIITSISACFSQEKTETSSKYYNDIGLQFGVMVSVKSQNSSYLFGSGYSLNYGHQYGRNGVGRIAVGYLMELDNTKQLSYATITYGYRSSIRRSMDVSSTTSSVGDLLFQLLQSVFPRNYELSVGPTIGYITESESNSILNYHEYNVNNNYLLSLDAGLRLHYNLWRFRLTGNMFAAYNLTNNFNYHFQSNPVASYTPKWFFKPSVGLSFAF